jgi:opacity protein-like surface antigen
MMRGVLVRVVAGAAVLMAGEAVHAADYPEPPPLQPVQEFASNWYVRGDAGYGFQRASGGADIAAPPITTGAPPFSRTRVDDAGAFDVGLGYRIGWFRADVTESVGTGAKFVGNTAAFSPDVTARIWNLTTLFNAYFDLGTWWGFTPYVGAGVGFSALRATELADNSVAAAGGSIGGANSFSYDLAWAANAGLSYYVSRNWLIDVSYRYLDMGTPRANVSNSPTIGTISFGNITAQQVRFGFRYQID